MNVSPQPTSDSQHFEVDSLTKVFSTDAFGGYTRNSVSLGMKYRY